MFVCLLVIFFCSQKNPDFSLLLHKSMFLCVPLCAYRGRGCFFVLFFFSYSYAEEKDEGEKRKEKK